jgi:catechol 2,3-dioxygenase-like lactoylglutathione lyase family enzyme
MALLVRDYDEAIEFYTQKLDFVLVCDEVQSPKKRWVLVSPPSTSPQTSSCLLLAKADGDAQAAIIGNQAGGRVFLFLHTNDFWRDYNKMVSRSVTFVRDPVEQDYGTVAVFADLYGNKWDLVQMKNQRK